MRVGRKRKIKMRYLVSCFFQFLPEQHRSIGFHDDLCLKIGPSSVTKILMILSCKTICASVHATAIAIECISPTAFPVGRERLGYYLFSRQLLEYLKFCRRRLANVLSGIFVVGIRWVSNLSHKCNNNASVVKMQELTPQSHREHRGRPLRIYFSHLPCSLCLCGDKSFCINSSVCGSEPSRKVCRPTTLKPFFS